MNDRSRMMTYALVAMACIVWIWQSVKEAVSNGTALGTTTIIFLVCIGIAAVYCIVSALVLWWRQPGRNDEDSASQDNEKNTQAGSETEDGNEEDRASSDISDHASRQEH